MKYISDMRKFEKIKELAKNGDQAAKDFLFSFMDMDDDKANDYLATIAVDGEGNKTEWEEVITALIADENEAIDGYDKAIKYVSNAAFDDELLKAAYIEKLTQIKDDEVKHIEDLKELLNNGNQD